MAKMLRKERLIRERVSLVPELIKFKEGSSLIREFKNSLKWSDSGANIFNDHRQNNAFATFNELL